MKNKIIFLSVAFIAVIGTIFVQLKFNNVNHRVHQHNEHTLSEDIVDDPTGCINNTVISATQYDSEAIDIEKLQTHLPLVMIYTDEEIPGSAYYEEGSWHRSYTTTSTGETELRAVMEIIDNKNTYNSIKSDPAMTSDINIRVRGNSSRWFDKKSYAIDLINNKGDNFDQSIMGMEKGHSWALHGPFLDKTLMRNYLAMNLSGEIMDYAPDVRFCEVIINGEYQGLYVMMETVSKGEGRIDIEKPDYTKNVTGYIIEFDNSSDVPTTALNNFTKYTSILKPNAFIDIVYPGEERLTPEIKEYIEKDVSAFEKALYSFDYDTFNYGFKNYVDVDELVNYVIINEIFQQYDTGKLSTYFYKSINGKYKPCVWDFNNSLDNNSVNILDDFYIRKFVTVQAPWFWMMCKDEDFIESIISRYRQLRTTIFSDEYLIQYIDDVQDYLGYSIDRNYAVWGYSFDSNNLNEHNKLNPQERNPNSYNEAINMMTDTLMERLKWLDENIEILRQYCHESAVKKFNH